MNVLKSFAYRDRFLVITLSCQPKGCIMVSKRVVLNILVSSLLLVLCSFAQDEKEDVVYLKNGSIIRGAIIQEAPGGSVVIRSRDGITFTFQSSQVARITRAGQSMKVQDSMGSEKSPLLAGGLSLVVPGVGQIYNGEVLWGLVHTTLAAGGIVVALTLGEEAVGYYERVGTRTLRDSQGRISGYEPIYGTVYYDEANEWLYIGLGVAGATLIYSVIDAIVGAKSHNERLRLSRGSLSLGNSIIFLSPDRGGAKLQLRLAF